jgi:hypothetical protein
MSEGGDERSGITERPADGPVTSKAKYETTCLRREAEPIIHGHFSQANFGLTDSKDSVP